ncbi:MAG: hypothetical protein HZB76_04445 [Chlamydiae bacterium]|nr:hypothetical protein [Chlamydiota bacterium]
MAAAGKPTGLKQGTVASRQRELAAAMAAAAAPKASTASTSTAQSRSRVAALAQTLAIPTTGQANTERTTPQPLAGLKVVKDCKTTANIQAAVSSVAAFRRVDEKGPRLTAQEIEGQFAGESVTIEGQRLMLERIKIQQRDEALVSRLQRTRAAASNPEGGAAGGAPADVDEAYVRQLEEQEAATQARLRAEQEKLNEAAARALEAQWNQEAKSEPLCYDQDEQLAIQLAKEEAKAADCSELPPYQP